MGQNLKEKITAKEALLLLDVSSTRSYWRYKKEFNITEFDTGDGKVKYYLRSEIEKIALIKNKRVPSNHRKKSNKIKSNIEKNKKKAEKTKTKTREMLNIKDSEIEEELPTQQAVFKPSTNELQNPLNEVGMAEYERITNLLTEQGTYKDVDRALVLAYSISYQKYIFATVASGNEDDTFMDSFGNLKLHPYFQVAKEAFSQMERTAKLLGIGARSRVGLEVAKPKKETIFDVLNSNEGFD